MGNKTGLVNVGSGQGHTLNQIVHLVREVTGASLPVETAPRRVYDVAEIVLDISRAKNEFGWQPCIDLRAGVLATWQHYEQRRRLGV
jgi:UDP-glucose 4-epimerase